MKLHIVLITALLLPLGCERKDPSKPDLATATTQSDDDAGGQRAAAPFYYTAHLDDDGKPAFQNPMAGRANLWEARHGHQPTTWNDWQTKPLTIAGSQGKPVLLVVGSIGCTPCVAASEWFDDQGVAKVVNERYVPVLVDENDRPDIAAFVRDSVHALDGKAPQSLVVTLTPDGHVVSDLSGSANAADLATKLTTFADEFASKREEIAGTAKGTTAKVRKRQMDLAGRTPESRAVLDTALGALHQSYDGEHHGWPAGAAKSPSPLLVRYALRASRWADEKDATLALATQTLDAMTEHLADERGYFTSTADPSWKLNHKVKSLAENAMLLLAYTEAWQLTDAERYEKAARNIASFIIGDLQAPDGGFFAHAVVRPDGETVFDERILADANGAAMAALARAGWVFDEPSWVQAAVVASKGLPTVNAKIVHSRANKKLAKVGYASDFAAAIDGLLTLFEVTADSAHLRRAALLQNQLDVMHRDTEGGGYFHLPTAVAGELPVRMKLYRERGVPSANGLSMINVARLEVFREDTAMTERRNELLRAFGGTLAAQPAASPSQLLMLDWTAGDRKRVVVVGNERQAMLDVLRKGFWPHALYATIAKNASVPWLAGKAPVDGKATAYVCRAQCADPITEPAEFEKALASE